MNTISLKRKELVQSLLKDFLVSYRLIQGLHKSGLDTWRVDLYLSETIFKLMGFGDSTEDEALFERFLNWSEKVMDIDFSEDTRNEPLNDLRDSIYRKLKKERKLRKFKILSNKIRR